MRGCFVLLLAVIVLLASTNSVSGSTVKLRTPQNPIQVETNNERVLREDVKTDKTIDTGEEERNALTNAITNFSKNSKALIKHQRLVARLKSQSRYVYTDSIAAKLIARKISPDDMVNALQLTIKANRWSPNGGNKAVYKLWLSYFETYTTKFPKWKPTYTPGQL